jgi:hypothetical protein
MHIAEKKWQLIIRDPFGREYDSLLKKCLQQRPDNNIREKLYWLGEKIRRKYNCRMYIPETTIQGFSTDWHISADPRISVKDAREGGTIIISEDGQIHSYNWEIENHIYCPPHMIPILIDPTTLTLNDEKRIKQEIWDIVKKEIKKSTKSNGKWSPRAPEGEPQELARVLRLKDYTFRKYLHWYDLKNAGLPFRLIAFVFQASSEDRRGEVLQNLIESERLPRVRQTVHGESTVRGGFDLIFEAIHRQKPPGPEAQIETQETYCCPTHNQDCGEDCPYLKDWFNRFNASCKRI